MVHDEIQRIFDELDDLLDAERLALLEGRLDDVHRLFDRKSRLMDTLGDMQVDAFDQAALLRVKIERNQDLLTSAADGIRSVARRLAAIRRVRESLETYDERGQRKTVDVKPGTTLEKRA